MSSRRVDVVATVLQCMLCIVVFTWISLETTQQFNTSTKDEYPRKVKIRRRLSLTSDYCNGMERPPPQLLSVPNLLDKSAVYAAIFPGSGDKLTKHLIENTTGLLVGEAFSSPSLERMKAQHMDRTGFAKGQGEVVAVRTTYPHSSKLAAWDYDIHGAIVVLRNPLTAIPSYFDQLYELNSHVPAGDSSVETTNQFIKWRDNQLSDQLLLWQRFVSFWMEKFTEGNKRIFISYESLTTEVSGPQETVRLTEFLQGSMRASAMNISPSNQTMIDESIKTFANMDEIYCIWKNMATLATSHEGRLSHKDRPLTTENLVTISTMILELINQWSNHHQLVSILSAYNDEVLNRYQLVLNGYQIQQTSG